MNQQHITIDVRMHSCHMQLHLPIFLDMSTLDDIRRVFKMLTVEPWRNEDTCEKLRQFFPEWEQALKDQFDAAAAYQKAAESAMQEVMHYHPRSSGYRERKKELAQSIGAVKRAKTAIERCGKVRNAYNKILGD